MALEGREYCVNPYLRPPDGTNKCHIHSHNSYWMAGAAAMFLDAELRLVPLMVIHVK
jgi:hypothetical protein